MNIAYDFEVVEMVKNTIKKRVSYLYRTATTSYPCLLPHLGDSEGAGRIRLTRAQK